MLCLKKRKDSRIVSSFLIPIQNHPVVPFGGRRRFYTENLEALRRASIPTHYIACVKAIRFQGFKPFIPPLEISVNPGQSSWRGMDTTAYNDNGIFIDKTFIDMSIPVGESINHLVHDCFYK